MSKDLAAILQYLNQPNTDYAYMLTGPWGCGKTHFWKHVVTPEITCEDPAGEHTRIAYVSLYGIKRPEEIRSAVLAQLHPKLAKAGQLVATVGAFGLRMLGVDV